MFNERSPPGQRPRGKPKLNRKSKGNRNRSILNQRHCLLYPEWNSSNRRKKGWKNVESPQYPACMFYIPKTTTALRATKLLQLSTWHKRFGHVNNKILLKMASLGSTSGLTLFNENPSTLSGWCILGKMQRFPFNIRHEIATAPGQRIHSDICNLIQVTAPSGDRYFVTFKDYYSTYCITSTKE